LKGDQKGEAQVFCEHLFQAFGRLELQSCGAVLEHRVKKGAAATGFADLVWKPRVVVEMKKRAIVYQKLSEALAPVGDALPTPRAEASASEIDEIDQLRRIALDVTGPEPMSYTTA
jgi:hypothetical protein